MVTATFPKTFSKFTLGPLKLKNRIVMAPLTRQNSEDDGTRCLSKELSVDFMRRL